MMRVWWVRVAGFLWLGVVGLGVSVSLVAWGADVSDATYGSGSSDLGWVGSDLTVSQSSTTVPGTSLEDGRPQNFVARAVDGDTKISVVWDEPNVKWENSDGQRPGYYWVRYKIAGTYDYYPDVTSGSVPGNFAPTGYLSEVLGPCSVADAASSGCIPIESGKTYVVELAQRTNGDDKQTWPTGTKADWVQVYVEISAGDYSGSPKITGVSIDENAEEGGLWSVVTLEVDSTPAADASVEIIWDELSDAGTGERNDIRMENYPSIDYPSGKVVDPDSAVIRWHLESDRYSNNFSGRQRIFGIADTLLEPDPEIVPMRLVNFRGIDAEESVKTFNLRIDDNNSTTVSLHVITADASSVGVVEEVSDIEIRASFTTAVDSRCELSWSAEFAATDEEKLTKLEASDFDPLVAGSGVFVFEAEQRQSTQFWSVADDGVPEGLETLRFSTSSLDCANTYNTQWIRGVSRSVDIKIRASDVPVVSSVVAGDAGGDSTDRLATVDWGLGGADVSEISGFAVRWTPEVAGEVDAYYLTDPAVVWDTVAVSSASTRSQTFPASPDSLTSDTGYVVQVGVVTEVGADPIYSEVLSRVTTAAGSAPDPTSPPTNSPTTGSTVSASTETTASTVSPSTPSTQAPSTESTASTAIPVPQSPSTESTASTGPSATQPNDTQPPVTQSPSSQPSSSPSVSTEPSSPPVTQPDDTQPNDTQPPATQPANTPPNTQPAFGGGQSPIGGVGGGVPTAPSPQPATGTGFTDTVGTTHEDNIDRLAAGGITRGCNPPTNSRFCPGRAVTRGEMATFMVRAFDLSASESNLFADDDGNTHESNINALAVAEITRGCNPPENSRYCPDRPVTRAQMATFLARAMELAEGSGEFTDTADSPHANDINRIASVGITRGCNPPSNSRFCPDRAVTRGEMATFLIRAEDLET